MFTFKPIQSGFTFAIATAIGMTALLPFAAIAQPKPTYPNYSQLETAVVPAGTLIPVNFDQTDKILIGKRETRSLTLNVAIPIRDRNGNVVIPPGSQIVGQLEPKGNGSQFIARQVILSGNNWRSLNATSGVIATTETVTQGATAADILKGTIAGAGTATIIAGTTGDRHINALEVLGGAAVGALAGWALPASGTLGGSSQEMIAIKPSRDLTLTLNSNLALDDNPPQVNPPTLSPPLNNPRSYNRITRKTDSNLRRTASNW